MKQSGRTVLITGGTSGIGLELARRFLRKENQVIVTGRDEAKLAAAERELSGVRAIRCDVSDPDEIADLHGRMLREFPALDVIVNNAGIMRNIKLAVGRSLEEVAREIDTNLSGPIRMVQQFLPHLLLKPEAMIVNVTSGLAFVPFPAAPIYSAAKAGLRAYTRALRAQLAASTVRVVELAPPGTDTSLFHDGFEEETKNIRPMPLGKLADQAMAGIMSGKTEIRPGLSSALMLLSRLAPEFALRQLAKASGY